MAGPATALALLLLVAASVPSAATPQAVAFRDIAAEAGLAGFVTRYGAVMQKRTILENIGGGAGLVDLDGDGILDVYLPAGQPSYEALEARNGFFRGTRAGTFARAAAHSGAEPAGWFYGVAAADYDDDGYRDFYLTAYGRNALLRNNGDGTFSDVTDAAGADFPGFSTGAAWADIERNGWLDLVVVNYVVVDPATVAQPGSGPFCRWKGVAVPCGPRGLGGERAVLLRNDGRGGFERAQEADFADADFYGLGVVFSDHDADGWIDLYVADDQTPNRLFLNRQGRLEEVGLLSGTAFSEDGHAEAGMGTDWADVDGDGLADIFVTNFADETNTLYMAIAPGLYYDATVPARLALPSFRSVGWGTGFRDFDNDGALDIFVANGHVYSQVDTYELEDTYPQLDHLFLRRGEHYEPWQPSEDDALAVAAVSRGAAFGDLDGDGGIDVLVSVLDGPPLLLRNELERGSSLQIRLHGRSGNRGAVGARVIVEAPGLPPQTREVQAGHSYLSQSDYAMHVGLGEATSARVSVHWPSGPVRPPTVIDEVPADAILVVTEGRAHRVIRREQFVTSIHRSGKGPR